MKKQSALISLILLSVFFLTGCVHQTIRLYQDNTLTQDTLSLLVTDSKDVSIDRINGKKLYTIQEMWNGKWNAEVMLKPDEYEINVKYWNGPTFKPHIHSHYLFKLKTLPGHTYQIKHKVFERSTKIWIVDLKSSEKVGKVLASENEALTEDDPILDHSVFYQYHPPTGENWIIAYRNQEQTALAKKGPHLDETFGLNIILFDLPELNSEKEFVEFVKSKFLKSTPSQRFHLIEKKIDVYKNFNDFCVSYHSSILDKKAIKRSKNKAPMILEVAGFICRHPKNKNIGVNFDYSHRYYKGHEDESLLPRAEKLFKQLEL